MQRSPRASMPSHWLSRSQWALPTASNYQWLRGVLNTSGGDYLRREYEDLRREYEDLRREYKDLRRPFDATAGAHFTDVWTYHTVQARPGKHPCEKPSQMARDIVAQCSRPGDVVLDTFAGSGAFLRAAAELGRVAWGCDKDEHWAKAAADAVASASWLNGVGK
jgi:adenine-specific DNA-methyltransferase